ncbi:glutamate--cysteine ligase [Mycolicibacterium gilvum]|uniref:Glutamate--cysteine ligase, GCS2 n=1 Tax=Mycolicibacterium gilvum TaxID=1804 RepID=A0A378ST25_9MYCO|nr:glutamate--cysteine ligase [Mycolicibacterium gilvum]MCV7058081.1 glutamate--cysteine ligase [Mycolicibacterium gilvum]STZ45962.1 glutamate--cysteine ligase, GCS2 [Mycolicibacterium gilvum]
MGQEISATLKQTEFSRAHRREYRRKVQLCLDVFETMLAQASFDFEKPLTGMEIECNLVDSAYQPAMNNSEVLDAIADPAYQTELGAYNIEFNVPPRRLPGRAALDLEAEVRASLNAAESKAGTDGSHIVMIGILPTLMPEHLTGHWMSESTRYQALNDSIFTARGEDIMIDISGPERLSLQTASIAPESACTSMQLHLQVSPADFANNWNAAQVVAGPQLALGANSPYFFGHHLWAETRIELFAQATDTRPDELKTQGVRPRVWFGERWITSIFDLFEENVRYFPSLLPELSDEDPAAELAAGRTPKLSELRLHNGTIYRWNRPVYDIVNDRPHLRVENRVLPAGPTVVDMMANAAFYYGVLRTLSEEDRPLWTKMSFAAAESNFMAAAQHGMDARLYWPGEGEVTPDELILRRLLPMAEEGLRRWEVAAEVRDRYLGVIEGRAKTGRNGAVWQSEAVTALQDRGLSRPEALAEMLKLYCERMHANEPVHTWDLPV